MITPTLRRGITAMILCFALRCAVGFAQTTPPRPMATPPTSPAQGEATRPPGTQQNPTIPESARPVNPNPAAPPAAQNPPAQAPPGVTIPPQPSTSPVAPGEPTPLSSPSGGTQTTPLQNETPREPNLPLAQPRPLPPLPSLSRLGVQSDRTLTLTLTDAIRRALENNNDIEIQRDNVRLAETTLRSLEGVYQPVLNFNPQINNLVQAQQSTLGGSSSGGTTTTTDITGNSNLTKFFERGGGQYQFFFNNDRRTTNSTFNILNPVYSASLGVQFTQPLLRDRSIDNNRRQIRIQRKRVEQSDADFRRRTIDVIQQVQRAYWDLVFARRDLQNRISNLNLSRENLRQVEARIAAGSTAPLERAQVQTELANRESDLLIASQNISIAENNLKPLIFRDSQTPDWSSQLVPTDEPSFNETPVNLNDALKEARGNRPELQSLRLQREMNDVDLQYFRNQTRPRVDLQATVATTGLSGTPVPATGSTSASTIPAGVVVNGQVPLIFGDPTTSASAFLLSQINQIRTTQGLAPATVPLVALSTQTSGVPTNLVGGYARTLANLFKLETRNIVAGVNIQLPLHNKTAQANLAGAQIQRTQLEATVRQQEESIEVEVRNAAQAVETSRQRVITSRASVENAVIQLEGERRLYQVGRSTTFLLFQREDELANARDLELRAETDYNKALADLQRATSTTLHANNIIVERPTVP